jgi:hypothetical protein
MSRSVSHHPYAIAKAYLLFELGDHLGDWTDFLDYIRDVFTGKSGIEINIAGQKIKHFPAMERFDSWEGRETNTILQGELSEISVSTYGGIACVSLSPRDPDDTHHVMACHHAGAAFQAFMLAAFPSASLKQVAVFSNGESFYQRINLEPPVVAPQPQDA